MSAILSAFTIVLKYFCMDQVQTTAVRQLSITFTASLHCNLAVNQELTSSKNRIKSGFGLRALRVV